MDNRNTFRHRSLAALLAGALLTLCQAAMAQTEILDRVVAIVNDDVVMQSELDARTESVLERVRGQRGQLPPMDALRSQILEQLILERLQLSMARMYGMSIGDAQLNETIDNIIRRNQTDEQTLRAELESQGLTMEQFRDDIRREMLITQFQQGMVNSRIRVTDQEIDNFLASTDGRQATSPDYRLGHILIAVPSGSSPEEVAEYQTRAEDIHRQLQDGADFHTLAMTYSNDPNALDGGEMGWRRLAQLPELFSNVVYELAEGESSQPFRSGAGFHILKNIEQRGGGQQLVAQTKARHILIKVTEVVDDDIAQDRLEGLRQRVLDGEDFATLARQNSEDIGSMLDGGNLGWATSGTFVPVFEETMARMDIDEVSEPFKSQFGWHILQVVDRREEDMSDLMRRNQADQTLRARRFEEELQIWLTEIREDAYVEIKI